MNETNVASIPSRLDTAEAALDSVLTEFALALAEEAYREGVEAACECLDQVPNGAYLALAAGIRKELLEVDPSEFTL
jgi:hypothetical protein